MKRLVLRAAILCLLLCACHRPEEPIRYWQNLTDDQKHAFVSGFFDCYATDHRKDLSLTFGGNASQQIDVRFQGNKPNNAADVIAAAEELVHHQLGPLPETVGERHFYFNGDYWWQINFLERKAFVAAYLACRNKYMGDTASKSDEYYANAVSEWFGVSQTKDDERSNAARRYDKVGDVLVSLLKEDDGN